VSPVKDIVMMLVVSLDIEDIVKENVVFIVWFIRTEVETFYMKLGRVGFIGQQN
jgi:hypothetical protein